MDIALTAIKIALSELNDAELHALIERCAVYHPQLFARLYYPDLGRTIERAYAQARGAIKAEPKRRGIV